MPRERISAGVADWLIDLGTSTSFADARRELAKLTGREVSAESIRKQTEGRGMGLEAADAAAARRVEATRLLARSEDFPPDDPFLREQGRHRGEPPFVVAGFQVMGPAHSALDREAELVEVEEALAQAHKRDCLRIRLPQFVEGGLSLLRSDRSRAMHSTHVLDATHLVQPVCSYTVAPASSSRENRTRATLPAELRGRQCLKTINLMSA